MIFTPENCELVLSGAKTMTRRVVKPGDAINRAILESTGVKVALYAHAMKPNMVVRSVWHEGRLRWRVGQTYGIQPGRGKKSVGRIVITDIRRERLGDISAADCIREGATRVVNGAFVGPLTSFKAIWDGLYGNDPVKGWQANPDVWVISFEMVSK